MITGMIILSIGFYSPLVSFVPIRDIKRRIRKRMGSQNRRVIENEMKSCSLPMSLPEAAKKANADVKPAIRNIKALIRLISGFIAGEYTPGGVGKQESFPADGESRELTHLDSSSVAGWVVANLSTQRL